MKHPRRAAVLLTMSFVVAACSSDAPVDSRRGATTPETSVAETTAPSPTIPVTTIPDTEVGAAATWVLDLLASDRDPSVEEVAERFAARFLAEVPPDEFIASLSVLRAEGPFEIVSYLGDGSTAEIGLQGGTGQRFRMVIGLTDQAISTLVLQPLRDVPEIERWPDVDAALDATGAEAHVLAARLVDGDWEPVHERGAGQAGPMGSVFKLYVLGAVQRAVLTGDISWEQSLEIDDSIRSLPTGVLQDLPSGTTVTVAEAAEKMISISDNTATDLLIRLVGRDAVEEMADEMGHHDPALLRPLLMTREAFRLGWTDPALRDRYGAADAAERRRMLAGLPDDPLSLDDLTLTDVAWRHDIDWFATASDILRAHRFLQAAAADDPTVRRILAINHGVEIDAERWPYVAYKGGSNPGVLAMSWYLEDPSGVPHGLVVQLASDDPATTADTGYVAGVAAQAIRLLAED